MGPTIILDKSAFQSLGQPAIRELGRYFYTVLPPVLLYETLADLSLDPNDVEGSRAEVRRIAKKLFPRDAFANMDFRTACLYDLLTGRMEMRRRAVVSGGKVIETADGEKGVLLSTSPANNAVLRWRHGSFSEEDVQFAKQWRQSIQAIDLDAEMKGLEKPEVRMESLPELQAGVDMLLADLDSQMPLLELLMSVLQLRGEHRNQIRSRWLLQRPGTIKGFAPYAFHCLRVHCLFYLGLSHHILGTRASNVVDIEYLCYSPFAHVFCSGDRLHQQLCPLILDADQEFVPHDDLRMALRSVVELRERASGDGSAAPLAVEPDEASLIGRLWNKYIGRPPVAQQPTGVPEQVSDSIMKKMKPIMKAIERASKEGEPLQRFSNPATWKKQTFPLSILPDLKSKIPNVVVGYVTADVRNSDHNAALWQDIEAVAVRYRGVDMDEARKSPPIKALRDAYRTLGNDPTRYRGSNEALVRRISQGKDLYHVNTVVDINNLISLETLHSAGSFDLDRVQPPIIFRVGQPGEVYSGIGRGEIKIEGLPVFADQLGPFGSTTSDSERTMVGLETTRIMMVIISFLGIKGMAEILVKVPALLGKYAAATGIETGIVT